MTAGAGRAFQKVDPHLRTHPYFKRLSRITGLDPNLLNGVLSGLWSFAYDHAQDGDLSRFTADDIADGCDWSFDAEKMIAALIKSGFITKDMVIHDWFDWGGARFTDQAYETARKADQRYRRKLIEQEEMSPGQNGTKRDKAGLSRYVPQEEIREEEKEISLVPKRVSAVTPEEWQQRADAVLTATGYPGLYRDLAAVMAAENKTGEVRLSRVVRELYEPLLAAEQNGHGDGFEHGLRKAIANGAPNVNYVKKAASNAPECKAPRPAGNGRLRYKDYATAGEPWRYSDDDSLVTP